MFPPLLFAVNLLSTGIGRAIAGSVLTVAILLGAYFYGQSSGLQSGREECSRKFAVAIAEQVKANKKIEDENARKKVQLEDALSQSNSDAAAIILEEEARHKTAEEYLKLLYSQPQPAQCLLNSDDIKAMQ